jgi:hypothetical protein
VEVVCVLFAVIGALVLMLLGIRALLFGQTSDRESAQAIPIEYCRNCGRRRSRTDTVCPRCGLIEADADDLADLRATQRNLRAFLREGLIDDETFDRLRRRIGRQRRRITGRDEPSREPSLFDSSPRASEEVSELPLLEQPSLEATGLPLEEPVAPSPETATTDSAPRRGVYRWFAAFMETRNILWGELVGGLLIVGCSIALVLSLWQTLEQIPLFPFIILATITAMLFGAGHYTLHHWKLEATSRGLLAIGLLLTPLSFLVLAGLSPRSSGDLAEIGIKVLGIGLFAFLVPRAARVLFPHDESSGWRATATSGRLLAFALLGVSLTPLVTARVLALDAQSILPLLILMIWPLACHALAIALAIRQRSNGDTTQHTSLRLLGFVALATFPLLLVFGFTWVTYHTRFGEWTRLLEALAPYAAAAAVPVIAAGLFMNRFPGASILPVLLGTGVAILGALVQTTALVVAWPNPVAVLALTLICTTAWTAAAVLCRMPLAHAAALPHFVIACLTAFQMVWAGVTPAQLHWQPFVTSESGTLLAIVAVVLAAVADRLRQLNRWQHGIYHAATAGVVALISIGLMAFTADVFPFRSAAVGLAFIVAGMALERRWQMPNLGRAAACLIPFATLALLHGLMPGAQNKWAIVLAGEALALSLLPRSWEAAVAVAAALAAACGWFAWQPIAFTGHAATLTLLAGTAIVQAARQRRELLAAVGSLLLLAACAQAIITHVDSLNWPIAAFVFVAHAALLLPVLFVRPFQSVSAPLMISSKLSSLLGGLCVAASLSATEWRVQALAAGALAVLWFAYLLRERQPIWFTAFQSAITVTFLFCVADWRQTPALVPFGFIEHFDMFGLALAITCIGWTLLRLLRPQVPWLDSPWPALDRTLLAIVLGGTILMVVTAVLPGVLIESLPHEAGQELIPRQPLPGTWWLLLALAVALLLNLREARLPGRQTAILVGLTIIGVLIPLAIAPQWADQRATASALRWGLSLLFLLGTLVILCRDSIVRAAHRFGIPACESGNFEPDFPTRLTRGVLLAVAGGIPLILTLSTLGQVIAGQKPLGPGDGSFFRQIGFTASHGIPLAIIAAGLVGHALRERAPIYAFSAGLIAKLLVAGGFAVGLATAGKTFDDLAWVELSQRVTLTAGMWALGWLIVAKWIGRFRSVSPSDANRLPSSLWSVQLGIAIAGNLIVLGIVVLGVVFSTYLHAGPIGWIEYTGGPLGWLALAAAASAGGLRELFAGSRRWPYLFGGICACAVVLVACSATSYGVGWGHRALMLGWAAASLWALSWEQKRRSTWAIVFATLVVLLTVRGSFEGAEWLRTQTIALAVFFLLSQLIAARFPRAHSAEHGEDESFVVTHVWVGMTAIVMSLIVCITGDTITARLAGPLAIALLLPGLVRLANAASAGWKRHLSYATLALCVVLLTETGWALVDTGIRGEWLHRSVALLVALTAATIGCSFGLARILRSRQTWAGTARQIGPVLGLIAAGVIVLIIGQEALLFDKETRRTPLTLAEIALVTLAFTGLMFAAVAFAVKPWIDPFGLPDRWRSAYVYGAEILLVLLFLHARFNVPGLFPKIEAQVWAFVIMAIAFAGVGLAELFKRLRLEVLAGPLQRTGVFLPILPLLMFWLKPPLAVRAWLGDLAPGTVPLLNYFDQIPTDFAAYSLLWFLFGMLYAWIAVSRWSFRYALLAALAANVGLWALLFSQQVTLTLHPQLWLVPLALIILVSELIHHDRLKEEWSIGLRYLGLGMLYLSSTADLFITGLGNSTLLPLALAMLSILGVLAGILLRIKAYLFLGTGFLAVVVFSMIWHAAVDRQQTWIWWVSGIALGASILALFALFEKRRQKVLEVVDEIRRWR